jgi:hypothetical protein
MQLRFLVGALLLAMASPAVAAENVFIHLTANFKENDGPVCVAFNTAWQALHDGDSVTLFFDQDAAYGLKQWEPDRTDLSLYPLPERIKDLLSESFGVARETLPQDYQQYLKFLSQQGAHLVVNGFWNALTEVEATIRGREHILGYVEPVTLGEMLTLRKAATLYMRF